MLKGIPAVCDTIDAIVHVALVTTGQPPMPSLCEKVILFFARSYNSGITL